MLDSLPPLRLQLPSGWTFDLGGKAVIHLGRTVTDEQVDVDLTLFGAVECGVSRTHALISREQGGYYVVDLGSRNETLLNGARLHPGHSYLLQHGDQLRLGALELLVLLQKANEQASRC